MQKYRLVSIYVNIHAFFYSLLTIIRKSGIRQLRGAGCAGREVSADYLLVFGNYNAILENCTLFSAISLFIRLFAAKEPCPFPLGVRRICNPQHPVCAFWGCCWGIANPPVLIGRTFFYGGFQIRRDACRETFFFDAWREKCTLYL